MESPPVTEDYVDSLNGYTPEYPDVQVFGGDAHPLGEYAERVKEWQEQGIVHASAPTPPQDTSGKSIEQQLKEVKGKNATNRAQVYNGGPTIAKDDLGYPIVPGLRKQAMVRDVDEDGIGQA